MHACPCKSLYCSSMALIELCQFVLGNQLALSVSALIYFISTINVLMSVLGCGASPSWAFLMEVVIVCRCLKDQ